MQKISLDEQCVYQVVNTNQEPYYLFFNYNRTRQGWFVDVVSDNFKIYGIRITSIPNILKQWESVLGFGLAAKCEQNSEPMFYEDFSSERANLYILETGDLLFQKEIWKNLDINSTDNI